MTAGHDDPISAASAGLRALGVAPQRRVETLGLLSALLDLADSRGEVLLDSALIATEERLGIDACLEGYEWLEQLGVIERTWSGWMIPDFDAHHGPAGRTEASMAVLQRHLAASGDAPVTVPVPAVSPAADAAPVVPLRQWRRRIPAIAASVAVGVAALAGATQFAPQAAVSHRDGAVRTEGTASSLVETAPPLSAPSTAGAGVATTSASGPSSEVTTTTTSTTLLPPLPCLNPTINGVTGRSGLNLGRDSSGVLPPGVLPCP